MLHIIFLILKILGWILLGILALVLILFGILLLNPVKYKLNGSCDGTLESLSANAVVRWLFHLIAAEAEYKEGELKWHLRIAWKTFSSDGEEAEEKTAASPKKSSSKNTSKASMQKQSRQSAEKGNVKELVVPSNQTTVQQAASGVKSLPESKKNVSEKQEQQNLKKQMTQTADLPKQKKQPTLQKQNRQPKQKKVEVQEEKDLFERIYDGLTSPFRKLIQKIKYTFQKICDKVKILIKKKERLQAFLTYEIHKNAFAKAVKELKRLLKFLKPKRIKADIEFGFSDPAWTGYMLAFLGMAYPFLGEYTEFRPDFEKRVLKGVGDMEGKIRSIYFLIPALHLLLDKNVRITYRHIRNFKL